MLETNIDEIQVAGKIVFPFTAGTVLKMPTAVEQASQARKKSFSSSNPLALGSGSKNSRGVNVQTPLGWLAGRFNTGGIR